MFGKASSTSPKGALFWANSHPAGVAVLRVTAAHGARRRVFAPAGCTFMSFMGLSQVRHVPYSVVFPVCIFFLVYWLWCRGCMALGCLLQGSPTCLRYLGASIVRIC